MLNSLGISPRRRDDNQRITVAGVSRTPAPVTDPLNLEILQLVHDLKNQLTIIRMAATDGDPREEEAARVSRLTELQYSAERALLLINALLLDEHSLPPGRRPVDVNEVVRSTAATLSDGWSDAIRVQLRLWPEPLAVMAEVGDLDRVLLNLVLNAFDAMPQGGVLSIETTTADVGESSESAPVAYACLTVRDSGYGMTADVKARIFDPFFTTKKAGTGLGLRSVAFTVQQLHGRISLESEPGRGTTVAVLLPLASQASMLQFSAAKRPQDGRD
jgi:signal transduction histidine kinase